MNIMVQSFPYTAHRKVYLTTFITFAIATGIEVSLLSLILIAIVHVPLLRYILLIAIIGIWLLLMVMLLRPLVTRHRLTTTHFELRYGPLRLDIPREAILSARRVQEHLTVFQPMRAQVDTKKHRLAVTFSEEGQVLLTLRETFYVRIDGKQQPVDDILLNVNEPDVLLAALNTHLPVSVVINQPLDVVIPEKKIAHGGIPLPGITVDAEVAIRLERLTRRFKKFTAVDALNMTIRQGEIYGFLGSNGAGKTTAIKMIVGLLQPDEGHVQVMTYDAWREPLAAKAVLGYVADRSVVYERLTGREFLNFLAQARGLPHVESERYIESLLDVLELTEHADRLCGSYSFGMKRKLSLAAALLHRPRVLVLDEPLNGLDPQSARALKDLLVVLSRQGTTILLSTHDLSVAESLCHRVGIMHRGALIMEGSASELRERMMASNLEEVFLSLVAQKTQKAVQVQL